MWRKENLCTLLVGMQISTALLKTIWWFLEKLKRELPYNLTILLLSIYPKEMKSGTWRDICTPMFMSSLFKIWKQPKYPSTDEWIKKVIYIYDIPCTYGMKYYSTLKKKEILAYVTIWMNLEDIMISEISQTQKDKYPMISLISEI